MRIRRDKIVNTDIDYTYEQMKKDLFRLKKRYPFLQIGCIGKSVLNKNLYYIRLGTGANEVFYNAAHHALEWITSVVMMKFIEDFAEAYMYGDSIGGYSAESIWGRSSIYIVPMINPDGIDLVLNGVKKDNPYYDDLIKGNNKALNFGEVWQANIRGVDLNHNYDAAWDLGKKAEFEYGVYAPGPTRYSGEYPESEPETKAVADFTRAHDFRLVLAYHSQGELIYWNYMGMGSLKARCIGERFSHVCGYKLDETDGIASYSGYKDWFIQEYKRPGYTIEVGLGKNPLPISQFNRIYEDNIGLLAMAAML